MRDETKQPMNGSSEAEKDGGPAFPSVIHDPDEPSPIWFEGMTLRDYFAAKALQGLLVSAGAERTEKNRLADVAFEYADAMIRSRE